MERKSWKQKSGQRHHWFITRCSFSFSEHLSLVYFLSAESGQELYCEDWLQQYLPWCFSLILSSVLTVFRLAAGSYRLTRLQPNIHTCWLCLSFLTRVFLWIPLADSGILTCTFETPFKWRLWFEQQCLHVWHHPQDDESLHNETWQNLWRQRRMSAVQMYAA